MATAIALLLLPAASLAATTGNIWVSASGSYSGCARSAGPVAYDAAKDCSWAGAYSAAADGDSVLVMGGSYGNVTIPGTKTGSPTVSFTPATGESVTVADFTNGYVGDGNASGANNLTFNGPVTARQFRTDGTSNVTVDGWTVDGQNTVNQIMHFEGVNGFTLRNSEVFNNRNNSLSLGTGSNVTIDRSKFHDAGLDAGSGAHTECLYASGIDYLRITNSHFYRCSVMDVFITRWSGTSTDPQHGWIENNVFEKPWSTTGKVGSGYAFHFRNGGEPAPDIYDWDFRNNTFAGPLSFGTQSENVVQPSGLRVTGNIFLAGASCRTTNSTFANNIYAGGTCGGSGEIASTASALNAGFVGPTTQGDAGNNFRLTLGSPALDQGNIANYPATDQDGRARYVGVKPDLGAFEYGAIAGPDTTPPNTTITASPSSSTSTSASVSFTASESSTFNCRIDGGAWSSCTSPKAYSGLALGAHTFDVRATDVAGNVDPTPATASWNVTAPDTTAPDTTITASPSGSTSSTSASVAFSSSEAGSTFTCRIDGGAWAACTSPKAYSSLALGDHTFDVRATDGAGNVDATPATVTWTVIAGPDITPPDTAITSGPTGSTTSTSASFAFSATEAGTFECRMDGGAWASCASPKGYSALALGAHTFDVRATDTAGNVDPTPASRGWTISATPDTTPPDTTITSGPSGSTTSTSASFVFSATEAGTFECRLDSGTWSACTSPRAYSALSAGSHTFSVRATDIAGNTDLTPASRGWTITAPADTTPPNTSITSGPPGTTTATAATLAFSSSEAGSAFACRVDGSAWAPCTSPTGYSGLAVGAHTFDVRATDGSGNVDATPATRSWTIVPPAPDTTAPDTTITAGPSGSTSDTTASVSFTSTEADSAFECRLDAGSWAACASPEGYAGLAVGAHTLAVRATDATGNVDLSPASRTWIVVAVPDTTPPPPVDTTAPDTAITGTPSLITASRTAVFGFYGTESGPLDCSLDGQAYSRCTGPKTYSSLHRGRHVFRVRATDLAGNVDATPAEYRWIIYRRWSGTYSFELLANGKGSEQVQADTLEGACALMPSARGRLAVRLNGVSVRHRGRRISVRGTVPELAVDGKNARVRVSVRSRGRWKLLASRRVKVRLDGSFSMRAPARKGALKVTAIARCG